MNNPVIHPFGSFFYRLTKWRRKYLHTKSFWLEIIANSLAVIISVLAYTEYPTAVLILGLAFLAAQLHPPIDTLLARKDREELRRKVIFEFFCFMNRTFFPTNENEHRFTLFTVDLVNKNFIAPYVRFYVGCPGMNEADKSKARYPWDTKGVGFGYTGMAWQRPKRFFYTTFPAFRSREDFEDYYINHLSIPKEVVKDISDYMVSVRQIFCYGFVDSKEQCLGILSLDSRIEWPQHPDAMPLLPEMLGALRTLLDSLFRSR